VKNQHIFNKLVVNLVLRKPQREQPVPSCRAIVHQWCRLLCEYRTDHYKNTNIDEFATFTTIVNK